MILFIMWVRWTLAAVPLRSAHGPGLEVADPPGTCEPGGHGGDRAAGLCDPDIVNCSEAGNPSYPKEFDSVRADDPKLKRIEPPKLTLAEQFFLPQIAAGLGVTARHMVGRRLPEEGDHHPVSRGAARPESQLPGRAPAEQGRARPGQVRGLHALRHGLPGALHRHRRGDGPANLARPRKISSRASSSTSSGASTAACARRPARSRPSS